MSRLRQFSLFYIWIIVSMISLPIFAKPIDTTDYHYLFRTIYDQHNPLKEKAYEIFPVIYGHIYSPNYYFLPEKNQYLVKSYTIFEDRGDIETGSIAKTYSTNRHVLLDHQGRELSVYDTRANISRFSGLFFHSSHYVNWLQTGSTEKINYESIYNQDLLMDSKQFADTFMVLDEQAEYREYAYLRHTEDNDYAAAVVFKTNNKWVILLSGKQDNFISQTYGDVDPKTAITENEYYFSSRYINNYQKFLRTLSAPIEVIPLVTETENPYHYRSLFNSSELRLHKYAEDWAEGIQQYTALPLYFPGDSYGTAFVQLSIKGSNFKFKIPNVIKTDFRPIYNLGVRTFKLPQEFDSDSSLTFIEATKNWNSSDPENLVGVGIYVIRHRQSNDVSIGHKLPTGLTEDRYQKLPIPLQKALLDTEGTTSLIISYGTMPKFLPEIALLKNLTYLNIHTKLTEIPADIAKLKKLVVLDVTSNQIQNNISPAISKLNELRVFKASSNFINEFPTELLSLSNIEKINLEHNNITKIPAEIANLKTLKRLELKFEIIESLPKTMASMEQLSLNGLFDKSDKEKHSEKFHHLFTRNKAD